MYLFLLHVEIVNNDTNEEVEREEWAKDNKQNEVQIERLPAFVRRLQIFLQK